MIVQNTEKEKASTLFRDNITLINQGNINLNINPEIDEEEIEKEYAIFSSDYMKPNDPEYNPFMVG